MPPTRRALLGGLLLAPLLGALPRAGRGPKLLLVSAYGGWDTTYALDPKPGVAAFDAPTGTVRRYADIEILSAPSRPSVDAFFERAASFSVVLRGIAVKSLSHPQCTRRMLTGTTAAGAPDVAAIAASVQGADRPLPYLVASPAAFSGRFAAQSAHAGVTNQLAALIDPALEPPGQARPDLDGADEDAIAGWLRGRASREGSARGRFGDNARRLADFRSSVDRAEALDAWPGLFEPSGEPVSFEASAAQAARALSAGVSWAAAVDSGLDFDTHEGNANQDPLHEALFARLSSLLDTLESTPGEAGGALLDETTVVVISEMTRTPRLTATGGKDHWPYATLLAFGAGLRGGRVFGETDAEGLGRPVDLSTGDVGGGEVPEPASVLAALLELAGVDPAPYYPGAEVFRVFLA